MKNRIVMSPMSNYMATPKGEVTDREIAFYVARARGGAGLIAMGASYVHPSGSFGVGQMGIYDDSLVPGLKRMVEAIHAAGAKISIQLHHAGRQTTSAVTGYQPVAPSPVPCPVKKEMPHPLTKAEIAEMVENFAQAARRAREAGFDIVEIHCAHGYLPAQFLSPYSNKRADEYGGDLQGRTRFAVEILRRCREVLGEGIPVICRIVGDEMVEDGIHLDEARKIARVLESVGAAAISVSTGVAPFFYTVPNMAVEPGWNRKSAAGIKEAVGVPVIVAGRINDPQLAEEILAERQADLINMGRPLIADPELPIKAMAGRFDDIRKCIGCNKGCHDRRRKDRSTQCLVNPEAGRETTLTLVPAEKPRRVVVVGGGPAGMEAARAAALRGHRVILFERQDKLGGRLSLAAVPPQKSGYAEAVSYLSREVSRLPVEIRTGRAVTAEEVLALDPDAVILATGARPAVPRIPGLAESGFVTADEVLEKGGLPRDQVLVIGGGAVGAETAHLLATQGQHVTVVEMLSEIAQDIPDDARFHLLRAFENLPVRILTSTTVKGLEKGRARVERDGREETLERFDAVVLAAGAVPNAELAVELRNKVKDVHVVGDVVEPRDALRAIYEGSVAGRAV